MKIEFWKVPINSTEFQIESNSVKFLGNFSKISNKLVKIEGQIKANCEVLCCKCGNQFNIDIDEKSNLMVSDGIYSSQNEDEDFIIIEIEDHIVDFDSILHSEIESIKSEYYVCQSCQENDSFIEKEY